MHILLCGRLNIETMMWRTGQGGLGMHEYEIIHEIVNACGGAVRSEKDGAVVYTLALGAVTHKYTFQE